MHSNFHWAVYYQHLFPTQHRGEMLAGLVLGLELELGLGLGLGLGSHAAQRGDVGRHFHSIQKCHLFYLIRWQNEGSQVYMVPFF